MEQDGNIKTSEVFCPYCWAPIAVRHRTTELNTNCLECDRLFGISIRKLSFNNSLGIVTADSLMTYEAFVIPIEDNGFRETFGNSKDGDNVILLFKKKWFRNKLQEMPSMIINPRTKRVFKFE